MAAGRNGVPTPAAGALRIAERTGGHPERTTERSGATRSRSARAARPRPAPAGPYDVDDADPAVSDAPGVLDFGAIRVPVSPRGAVSVEPTANGRMQSVQVTLPGGRLSVSALAAPKSSKLWPQLAKEIDASLREGGAKVRSFKGEWGRELHATTGAATSVFVGVDGPRWMVYGVATGPTRDSADLDAELRRMLRGSVVVRGRSPYPVRTVLPLTTPESLADDAAAPTPAVPAPVGAPEPPPAEPTWADPVHRISDPGDADLLPEDDVAVGTTTSAWPVDEGTGRPRPPEWLTGEHPAAPPVDAQSTAPTEPILMTAVPQDTAGRGSGGAPSRDRGGGIDAYYGWDRQGAARPHAVAGPAPDIEAPLDPLDPAAPVDTRWLDEPGVTTAWEALPAAPEPEPQQQDWAEWARRELDRAVAAQAEPEPDPEPASFWERFGLPEPTTGRRATRRASAHGPGDDDQPQGTGPRRPTGDAPSADDTVTARRLSRIDPDVPERPREDERVTVAPVVASATPAQPSGWAGGWPGRPTSATPVGRAGSGPARSAGTSTSGRRHAGAGGTRLSVAELARRAADDRAGRRGRHSRPGSDGGT